MVRFPRTWRRSREPRCRSRPFPLLPIGCWRGWWRGENRPLDPVYPVIFIDCVNVKIRDGNVANRPIYVALAVTVEGHRDILGSGLGSTVMGREVLDASAVGDQEPGHPGLPDRRV